MVCKEATHMLTITKEGFDRVFTAYKEKIVGQKVIFF
jgi:hypothetical protein